MRLNSRIKKIRRIIKRLPNIIEWLLFAFPEKKRFGYFGKNSLIDYPTYIYEPKTFYLCDNAKVKRELKVINSPGEKVTIKKYTSIAANCTIVTNNHRSTVGIPQFLLGATHINDKSGDVCINEDVWVGTGVIILQNVTLGRGCVVGAGSVVTKSVPPYAVVCGNPARIVAKKFEIEDILKHENVLYPSKERLSKEALEQIFSKYFVGLKTFGTSMPLDDKSLDILNKAKEDSHYIEPDLS